MCAVVIHYTLSFQQTAFYMHLYSDKLFITGIGDGAPDTLTIQIFFIYKPLALSDVQL